MLNRESVELLKYFLRSYPRRSALMVVLLMLAGLAEGVGVVTLLPLLDLAVTDRPEPSGLSQAVGGALTRIGLTPSLTVLLGLIVVGMSLKAGFLWLAMKQVGYTVAQIATDLRLMLMRALMHARWRYFASQSAGQVANSISNEAHRAAGAYRELCFVLAGLVQILVYLGIAVMVSWQVAVFALAGGLLVLVTLRTLVARGRAAGGQETRLLRSLVGRVTDALHGIKAIKAMGKEEHVLPLLERETLELNKALERGVLARETMRSLQEPLLVVMLAVGLFAVITFGDEPFSAVLVLAFLFYRLATQINVMQMHYQTMATCESAFWSIRERAADAEKQREPRGEVGSVPVALREGIRFDSVSFSYGHATILDAVSFRIPAGRFVAVAGPSGVGKTTLVDLIVGLHRPERGRILLDERPLEQLDVMAWRRVIGYVPQETFLLHDTILHNVTLGDTGVSRDDAWEVLERAGAADFVRRLPEGIDSIVGESGSKLSGGQRQRISIARALVGRPLLLILDEVTTALDPETEAAICATLQKLSGEVTIVAISHQAAISQAADVRYRLDAGRIYGPGAESGRPTPAASLPKSASVARPGRSNGEEDVAAQEAAAILNRRAKPARRRAKMVPGRVLSADRLMGGPAGSPRWPHRLKENGARSEVLLVPFEGGLAVKKVFRSGARRHLNREVFARVQLSTLFEEVPPLLGSGSNYILSPYYQDLLRYRRDGLRLFPLHTARRVVDFLERLYEHGFALLDAHPENVLVDGDGRLRLFDFEFLTLYGSHKPASFEQSWDVAGPPPEFEGDRPAGGCPTWRTHWQMFVGLSLNELRHDPLPIQHLKRARHWLFRFLPHWLDRRLPASLLKVKAGLGSGARKAYGRLKPSA